MDETQIEKHGRGHLDERVVPFSGAFKLSEPEFIALVEGYSDDLRRFFRRRGVELYECKDRTQECFEVLWRRRSDVDPAKAKHCLFGIARNVVAAHWRRQMQEEAIIDVLSPSNVPAVRGADGCMEIAEGLQRLNRLRDFLPPRQREVLELVYGLDLSVAEAARRLGISRGTVMSYHDRALKTLAERIQQDSE